MWFVKCNDMTSTMMLEDVFVCYMQERAYVADIREA